MLTGAGKGLCLSESKVSTAPGQATEVVGILSAAECAVGSGNGGIDHDPKDGDPVPLSAPGGLAAQVFLWSAKSQQIVAGGSGNCLTVGNPNTGLTPHAGNAPGKPGAFTNNGTLHHEVWQGPLTPAVTSTGARLKRQVVALFNKGAETETIIGRAAIVGSTTTAWEVHFCFKFPLEMQKEWRIPPEKR